MAYNEEGRAYRIQVAREYMERIRSLRVDVDLKREEVEQAKEDLMPAGVSYEGADMPGSPNAYGDAIPDGLSLIQDRIADYTALLDAWAVESERAIAALNMLGDARHRAVLTRRYILAQGVAKTALRMCYSEPHVYELTQAALCELYDYLPPDAREPRHQAV